jgi:hypothetical protein
VDGCPGSVKLASCLLIISTWVFCQFWN